jgi:hypothetical protein
MMVPRAQDNWDKIEINQKMLDHPSAFAPSFFTGKISLATTQLKKQDV